MNSPLILNSWFFMLSKRVSSPEANSGELWVLLLHRYEANNLVGVVNGKVDITIRPH